MCHSWIIHSLSSLSLLKWEYTSKVSLHISIIHRVLFIDSHVYAFLNWFKKGIFYFLFKLFLLWPQLEIVESRHTARDNVLDFHFRYRPQYKNILISFSPQPKHIPHILQRENQHFSFDCATGFLSSTSVALFSRLLLHPRAEPSCPSITRHPPSLLQSWGAGQREVYSMDLLLLCCLF